jgi:hypothetical protein
MVRNKLKKAYDLGAGPLLAAFEKMETFPLRRRSGMASFSVHDNLAKLSIQQVMNVSVYSRNSTSPHTARNRLLLI